MIPADHWHDNGDGTAWWVVPEMLDPHTFDVTDVLALDRPCDTCGGTKLRHVASPDGSEVYAGPGKCPNCIDGRHTFEIEVADCCGLDATFCKPPLPYRVSIVPGMVLPVCELDSWGGYPEGAERFVHITPGGVFRVVDHATETDTHSGQGPSAAKPGKHWAVKLLVES